MGRLLLCDASWALMVKGHRLFVDISQFSLPYFEVEWVFNTPCFVSGECRAIIDLLASDKSRYFSQPRPIIVKYFFGDFSRMQVVVTKQAL